MTNELAIRVALYLLLDDRADTAQRDYEHSKYYGADNPISSETKRLRYFANEVYAGQKIEKHPRVYDLFAKVCQAYRLNAWELKDCFFLGESAQGSEP